MNTRLEYLADSLIIEALAKDSIIRVAQDGSVIESVGQGVKDFVLSQFDRKRPIASIVAFMGDGLLWSMGFRWMSVLYAVAEALGFDWKSFWSEVGSQMAGFAKGIVESQTPANEDDSIRIRSAVQDAFEKNFSGEPDKTKLLELASKKVFGSNMRDAYQLKALAIKIEKNPQLLKNAGWLSIFKGKLVRFFVRTITWLIRTAFISLGLMSGAGLASTLMGRENEDNDSNAPISKLEVSPKASPDLFQSHLNDMSNVWIERGNIETIDDLLKNWILSIYPQLSNNITDILNSSSYRSMVAKFRERNRLAGGVGLLSIPKPYQRKADVVSTIVNGYLQDHPQQSEQTGNNTIYK